MAGTNDLMIPSLTQAQQQIDSNCYNNQPPYAYPSPAYFQLQQYDHKQHPHNNRDTALATMEQPRDGGEEEPRDGGDEESKPTHTHTHTHAHHNHTHHHDDAFHHKQKHFTKQGKLLLMRIANGQELYKQKGKAGVAEKWEMVAKMINTDKHLNLHVTGKQCSAVYKSLIDEGLAKEKGAAFRSGTSESYGELEALVVDAVKGLKDVQDKKAENIAHKEEVRQAGLHVMEASYKTVAPLLEKSKEGHEGEGKEERISKKSARTSWAKKACDQNAETSKLISTWIETQQQKAKLLKEAAAEKLATHTLEKGQQAAMQHRALDAQEKSLALMQQQMVLQQQQMELQQQQMQQQNEFQQQQMMVQQQQQASIVTLFEQQKQMLEAFLKKTCKKKKNRIKEQME